MKKTKRSEMIKVNIDIDDDLLLQLAILAHERDMKLNDLIVELLEEAIKNHEKRQ